MATHVLLSAGIVYVAVVDRKRGAGDTQRQLDWYVSVGLMLLGNLGTIPAPARP